MRRSWRRWLFPLLMVLVSLSALIWQLGENPAHEERDISQERLEQASPPLNADATIGQTFLSRHDGLRAIEVLLVVYDQAQARPPDGRLTLTLERVDGAAPPVTSALAVEGLTHNQRLRFAFDPIPNSRGARYRLTLQSDGDYRLGFWHTVTEAYADGHMLLHGEAQPGDLLFATTYNYHLSDVLRDLANGLWRGLRLLPALALLLGLPGLAAVLYLSPRQRLDIWSLLALLIALSLAFWPLLMLWSSVAGVRWSAGGIGGLLAALAVVALVRLARLGRSGRWSALRMRHAGTASLADVALGAVLALTLATRVLQVRALVVPPWVDSVHHSLITQLIMRVGATPSSYAPYMPVEDFHYHFGFHANAAVLAWLAGLSAERAVLVLGQVLNVLAPLAAFALAVWLTRQRWAGVGAALVVGLLSYMPAYYLTWGRYTQLHGLVLLPPLCMATLWAWENALASHGASSWRQRHGAWLIAALLLAGLVLTHYRVLVFYALFLPAFGVLFAWRARRRRSRSDHAPSTLVRHSLLLGGGACLLALPWMWRFAARILPAVGSLYGGWEAIEHYNDFPSALLQVGWSKQLLYVAGAGTVWAALRRRALMAALALWAGLWFVAANLRWLGLPDVWLIHNSAVVISLWLPMGILCGWLAADVWGLLGGGLRSALRGLTLAKGIVRGDRLPAAIIADTQGVEAGSKPVATGQNDISNHGLLAQLAAYLLLAATLALGCVGAWRLVDIVNPVTVLVTPEDMQAMRWVAEHTPEDALFLVNSRGWQGELRAGSDAGWWLPILAGRQATQPCVLYYQGSVEYREGVNALAKAVEQAATLDDPALRELLERAGVTHVFVGARGGALMPAKLDGSPYYRLLYAHGPTRVYAFVPAP